jgi:hypothetical protein
VWYTVMQELCDGAISSYAVSVRRNSFHEEIKSRLKSGNYCYLSVQNLFSSSLQSKNTKINLYMYFYLLFGISLKLGRSHIQGGTQAEDVREQGAQEDTWA